MWLAEDFWRAPVGDFPPHWASAWGDDPYGIWADLTVNGVTQRMRWIEPSGPEGFWMGSLQVERDAAAGLYDLKYLNEYEYESHKEIIDRGFWLADTPCTQALWQAVTGKNPSYFKKGYESLDRPVESVSWNDILQQFIPCISKIANLEVNTVYLPTEVEWEYAARAGTHTAYWWGAYWDENRGNADVTSWRTWDGSQGTSVVKRYAPNYWGLYDVHGNVREFSVDVWKLPQEIQDTATYVEYRVTRGGSWVQNSCYARAASRRVAHQNYAEKDVGFRFALRYHYE